VAIDPIDATIAGATANSYVTLAEAETYFATRLNIAAWSAAVEANKQKALLTACRRIESCRLRSHRRPYGYPSALAMDELEVTSATQALAFPRYRDRNPSSGAYIIASAIKHAQCEEALALLSRGDTDERRRALQLQGVRSFAVDGLSESYGDAPASQVASQPLDSVEAQRLLMPYLAAGAVIATSPSPDGDWTPGTVGGR